MDRVLSHSTLDLVSRAALQLADLREKKPRVHCITNAAAQVFTANLLLAVGAIPSLSFAAEEVPFFTERAQALLINLGTLDAERRAAIPLAIHAAQKHRRPWVLDPVFVDASPPRLQIARDVLMHAPPLLRCNEKEFEALSGEPFSSAALAAYARTQRCVVAMTGSVDHVTDGTALITLHNGHRWMSETTAMGCAGTALIAALAGLGHPPREAAISGLLILGVAGEIAAGRAQGPGTFAPHFLDVLASLSADDLHRTARIRHES